MNGWHTVNPLSLKTAMIYSTFFVGSFQCTICKFFPLGPNMLNFRSSGLVVIQFACLGSESLGCNSAGTHENMCMIIPYVSMTTWLVDRDIHSQNIPICKMPGHFFNQLPTLKL